MSTDSTPPKDAQKMDAPIGRYLVNIELSGPERLLQRAEVSANRSTLGETADQLSKALLRILLVAALGAGLWWAATDPLFLKTWLSSLTKADVFGVKFERNVIEKVTTELAELLRKDVGRNAQTFSEAAVARAVHSAEAIVGANLLWVDDNPSNNARLVEILETLRIRVSVVGSTEEALAAMELLPFDVVVSDIWRKNDIGKAPECVNLFWTANFQIA